MAKGADAVMTLNHAMKNELIKMGVETDRISVVPNSCDADRFKPLARNNKLAMEWGIKQGIPVIGYVGTFVGYEGLDDLILACGILAEKGHDFKLLLVGSESTSSSKDGPLTIKLKEIVESCGLKEHVVFTGRVPHELGEDFYSLIDITPFPRKPLPVCELVSPMKPIEAMSMEKAVIVSSVEALSEFIQPYKTGLIFDKGNYEDLARCFIELLESAELRSDLGTNARNWVIEKRTWSRTAETAKDIIKSVM